MSELFKQINFQNLRFGEHQFSKQVIINAISDTAKYIQKYIKSQSPFILLTANNHIKTVIAYYAVLKVGKIAVIVDPQHKKFDWNEIIEDIDPSVIISLNTNQISFDYNSEITIRSARKDFNIMSNLTDVVTIAYTGAEDGFLKGAMLTEQNLISQVYPMIRTNKLTNLSVPCAYMPYSHLYGLIQGVLVATHFGGTSLIEEVNLIKLPTFVEEMINNNVTHFYSVPSIYYLMSKVPGMERLNNTIREYYSGGIHLTPYLFENFYKKTGRKIREGYGLTETSACAAYNYQEDDPIIGSFGKPFPGCEIKIVNNLGEVCDIDTIGEIMIKGNIVFKGYFNKPEQTEKVLENGWFKTGDLGYKDASGYLYFKGVKKRMINNNGVNVYPARLERLFLLHPNVVGPVIYGYESPLQGFTVRANIALRENTPEKQLEFKNWCINNINNSQLPKVWYFENN